jgi:hypothetical protein
VCERDGLDVDVAEAGAGEQPGEFAFVRETKDGGRPLRRRAPRAAVRARGRPRWIGSASCRVSARKRKLASMASSEPSANGSRSASACGTRAAGGADGRATPSRERRRGRRRQPRVSESSVLSTVEVELRVTPVSEWAAPSGSTDYTGDRQDVSADRGAGSARVPRRGSREGQDRDRGLSAADKARRLLGRLEPAAQREHAGYVRQRLA